MADKQMSFDEQVKLLRDAFERQDGSPSDDESLPEYMPLPSDDMDVVAIGFKRAPKSNGKPAGKSG